jgi:ATP phosphoribosyltransferase regulatory subunit
LRAVVRRLREDGEVVVFVLPGHDQQGQAVACDRELVSVGGRWVVQTRGAVPAHHD